MVHAKNYETLSTFVKLPYAEKTVASFFGHGV